MDKYSILNRSKLWDVLNYLTTQEHTFELYDLIHYFDIPKWELITYFNFLTDIGHDHVLCHENGNFIYTPSMTPLRFARSLSLIENLEFKQNSFDNTDKQFSAALSKLTYILEKSKPSFSDPKKVEFQKICGLQEAIFERKTLNIDYEEHSEVVTPLKLIILSNQLELVGAVEDSSIINTPLRVIQSYSLGQKINQCHFSDQEIHHFIDELYKMEKSKMRLVLKFSGDFKIPSLNQSIKLESPCEFRTSAGDIIWAATVESSDVIFDWLSELGPNIQILDPSHFKIEFIRYCEHKLKKLA